MAAIVPLDRKRNHTHHIAAIFFAELVLRSSMEIHRETTCWPNYAANQLVPYPSSLYQCMGILRNRCPRTITFYHRI